jgi:hypothetical protein
VLSFAHDQARLEVEKDALFTDVTESVRTLLQVCRLNQLPAAMIISHQSGFDFRSSVRVALKFAAARPAPLPRIRLALVALVAEDSTVQGVVEVAQEIGLVCKVFRDERAATAWLNAGAD